MSRIDYVILYVADLTASIGFYRDVLGLPFKFSEHGYAEFATEGTKLALYERARLLDLIGQVEPSAGPTGELCFVVGDVDAEAARLDRAGITIMSPPTDRPWGHRTLHVADPDGHVVELAQEIPRTPPRG